MDEKIAERLYFHNPWWVTGKVSPNLALPFKRKAFKKLSENLNLDRVLILKGPRRTGKTTIIYQLIDCLLQRGIEPFNLLYLSFDDLDLRIRLPEILRTWEKEAKKSLDNSPLLYVFLDEVQFLDNWETDVKLFYDKKYPLKFLVSGSSASLIRKTSESLAGRTIEEILLPLDFEEYSLLQGEEFGLDSLTLEKLKKAKVSFLPYEDKLFLLWEKYLEKGGFPHLVGLESADWQPILKEDIVDKVIYRDLVQLYNIKEPETLEKMFRYLAATSAGILNLSTLSSNLKISWETTLNYLTYLKQAYLVFTLPKYSHSPKETARSLEKAYVIDPAIMTIFSSANKAALWETVVARHLWQARQRSTYFWRNTTEVDIVLEEGSRLLPIEVKSSDEVDKKDLKGLFAFMKKYRCRKGIVFYGGKEEKQKNSLGEILFYPVYKLGFDLQEDFLKNV
ncbi:ATP-binding protein [Candidatus Shapirobacteria bacterium]|nr:ATP-binding protein [Candidatus Shapirobacteria bacterium]